jgi:hypothetical protein
MGIVNFFRRLEREAILGRPPSKFRHSNGRKMGIVLIETWKAYWVTHPDVNPKDFLDRPKVMYQVCRKLGYDDGWAQAFTPVEGHLGDVALSIMCSDLLYPGNKPKKHARTLKELHECFSTFLPDELGKLEDELKFWKDEL